MVVFYKTSYINKIMRFTKQLLQFSNFKGGNFVNFGKILMLSITILSLTGILVACGGDSETSAGSDGESVTLRLGHLGVPGDVYDLATIGFAEEVEERTDGRVTIELYGNAQLGGDREVMEQIQQGTLEMGLVSNGPVANFVPELGVLDLPFLFRDKEHFRSVLDGEIGDELANHVLDTGMRNLGYWEYGTVNINNNIQPIQHPDDMSGLSIRVQESEIILDTYKALGADPTTMAFPEVYTSLQQGVIDGSDGPYLSFTASNFYEVQNYLSEVAMFHRAAFLLINEDVYQSLSEEDQNILTELAIKHTKIQRDLSDEMELEYKQTVIDNGVEILESNEIDRDAFEDRVSKVYEKYESDFGDIVERIKDAE